MKASLALVVAGSLLAAASPIKRAIHTDYVTDLVLVTVTVDPATIQHPNTHTHTKSSTTTLKKTTTSSKKATPTSTTTPPTTPATTPTIAPTTAPTTTPTPPPAAPQAETITVTEGEQATTPTPAPAPAPAATTKAIVQQAAAAAPAKVKTSTAAAQPTPAKAAAAQPTDFSSTAVYHHNLHRSNHSAPAVSWNSDLAGYAATVAASCVFAHDLTPGASTGAYGQNIAVYGATGDVESISSSKIIAQAITDMWYNGEVTKFPDDNYGQSNPDMSNFEGWGHFSQVVWVASTEVGCAAQYCAPGTIYSDMGSWFSVCDYRSEGNMGGAYGTNVLRPLGQGTVSA